jgi:CBS domain-containing protein/Kef-type K+ transport system membrane component KefB
VLFGLMLVSAIVGGYAARLVHVPRVVGFLLAGVALRVLLYALLDAADDGAARSELQAAAEPLRVIKDLALGLILFTIGGVFERSKLRAAGWRVLKISALEIACVLVLVFAGCAAVLLATGQAHLSSQNVVLGLLLAAAAVATAPAATLFVLQEYEAKGSVTDTLLCVTGLNNIVCIVLFNSIFLLLVSWGVIDTTGTLAESFWLTLGMTTAGSVVLGVLCGTLISMLHATLRLSETLLFFFALFILLGAGEQWLWEHRGVSYNFLLTSLVTGAVFANIAIDSQKLDSTLQTVGTPIFAGFFVIAGYGLHVDDLAAMGWLGGIYVVCRFAGKALGCNLGVRWAGGPERADGRLGPALLCQAAVVIGLASFVERNWASELASQFTTVVLGSVVVFELAGPLLVKRCAVQAGEVKATTLLGRVGAFTEGTSVVRLALESLLRLVGWPWGRRSNQPETLLVKHIMRTNVQFIPASATFDEVLHAIERSTYSHFPVVDEKGGFAGVIHFSDVRDVIYDPSLSALVTAVDLADPDSPPVPQDMPLSDVLDLFTRQNVGALPVVDESGSKRIVGLIEQRDLLRALHLSKETR